LIFDFWFLIFDFWFLIFDFWFLIFHFVSFHFILHGINTNCWCTWRDRETQKVLKVLNIRSMNSQVFKNLCLLVAEMIKCSQFNTAHHKQIDEYLDFLA
jgi:hypothetical protein